MNVSIKYCDADGLIHSFTIYNAVSIVDAISRFMKSNPNCAVLGAEVIDHG